MYNKIFILAGEASGDMHGANLASALLKINPELKLKGWGGDRMKAAGVLLEKTLDELAFMGFIEVVMNLRKIKQNFVDCKQQILDFMPEAVILIDYPGFNLRMAKWLKQQNIHVIYYISPQLWAWKESRISTIKSYVDKMLVILPFEKDFYAKHNYEVTFVGHPLLDEIERLGIQTKESDLTHVALLPGSRNQEIKSMLPIMLQTASRFPETKFVVCGVKHLGASYYSSFQLPENVQLITGNTYKVLSQSKAALVTSGTATLETALFNVPQIVCYKGSSISYVIAKKLIKVNYISLVNLILNKPLLKELIQNELTVDNLSSELKSIIDKSKRYFEIQKGYTELHALIGKKGASDRAAKIILLDVQP